MKPSQIDQWVEAGKELERAKANFDAIKNAATNTVIDSVHTLNEQLESGMLSYGDVSAMCLVSHGRLHGLLSLLWETESTAMTEEILVSDNSSTRAIQKEGLVGLHLIRELRHGNVEGYFALGSIGRHWTLLNNADGALIGPEPVGDISSPLTLGHCYEDVKTVDGILKLINGV